MSRNPRRLRLLVIVAGLGLLTCFIVLIAWCSEEHRPSPSSQLVYGAIGQGELPANQGKTYSIQLRAGQLLHIVAKQLGADVDLTLFDPMGRELYRIDSPSGPVGAEQVFLVASSDGEYQVKVGDASKGKHSGSYQIFIQELRESTSLDRKNAEADQDFYRAKNLFEHRILPEARRLYQESVRLWGEVKNRGRQADGLCSLGEVGIAARDWTEAIEAYRRCAEDRAEGKNFRGLVPALVGGAQAKEYQGSLSEAKVLYARALHLCNALRWPEEGVKIEYRLARIQIGQGETSQALEHLGKIIATGENGKDKFLWLRALSARGALYSLLDKEDLALDDFERVFALAGKLNDFEDQAVALNQEASIYANRREFSRSVNLLEISLRLRRKMGNEVGEGTVFSTLGLVYYQAGRFDDALSAFQRAEQIFDKSREAVRRTVALTSLAWIHAVQRRPEIALKIFNDVLPLAKNGGNRPVESAVLYGIAYAERQKGNLIIAGAQIDEAIQVMESLRSSAARSDLQASLFADRETLYGFKVELLMDQHSLKPKAGYDLQAFQTSERARARNLYEALVKGTGPKMFLRACSCSTAICREKSTAGT